MEALFAMLFFIASLFRSSPFDFLVRLDFLVGEIGMFSCEIRFVDDGIFDRRRFGEGLLSLRAVLLLCGRRSGALVSVGNDGAETGLPPANKLCIDGCLFNGAVFCEINGGLPAFPLNGFFEDFGLVGEGSIGISSSSEASESTSCGLQRASASAAAAKMFLPVLGAFVTPFLRGDNAREAIEIGDGSAISISIGVPAGAPANIVCARPKGVLVVFLIAFIGSGDSIETSVKSVDD